MKKVSLFAIAAGLFFTTCKKETELDGNNIPFEVTQFELTEQLTFAIPNSFGIGSGICFDLPFGATIPFQEMIPATNPNPYAHLVYDIRPKVVKMELVNISGCDLGMLKDVKIYMVRKDVADIADIIIYDPANPTNPYNAVLMASASDVPDGSSVIYPDINPDIRLDDFIYDQDFQVFMDSEVDKSFLEDEALIKTTLELEVKLINDN